ncbi:MAG TPA: CaiB/BaiF CoA-transferase family protein [Burkholderiaceae bacterium]|nr:CaiB/BaiF CoA-transferase family protein [Burkholderiaceae bacterium]
MPHPQAPLAPYTVLDFTIARAGPTAVRLLADWGANVIRVEPTPQASERAFGGRRHGSDEQNLHRNKRSLCLDLKSPRGRAVLDRLVARADVVVENFRADVKQRLGLDYERLRSVNPRIVLASISGFGQDGPYAERPGVDQIVQGLSGLMSITGEPGRGPMRVGIAVSDTAAGMFLGQGILLALLQRERTGVGQWVHTSLLEAMLNKLDFQAVRYTMSGEVPRQEGNHHPTLAPMGTFRACDGVVNLAASSQKMWEGLCSALDAPQLAARPEFATDGLRNANRTALQEAVEAVTQRFAAAELVQRLNPVGVPCGPIVDIGQAFADPQVQHLRMTRAADHPVLGRVNLLRSPINLSTCPHPDRFERAAPDAGQHSAELLRETGFADAEVAALMKEGTVA